jgi:aspartate oxidase
VLLGEAHPLAALIARFALERMESRGVHQRLDYPRTDPALAQRHLVVAEGEELAWETWR